MLRRSSMIAFVLAASALAQEAVEKVAARPPTPAVATAKARAVPGHGFVLEAGDLAIEDLVDAAAQFLNRNILFSGHELGAGKGAGTSVRLQNRLELDALGCEEVLTSLLFSRGFALTPLDAGRNIYEVILMGGPRGKEVFSRATGMSADEVLRRPMLRIVVLTTLELKHINAPIAVNALRPFYGQQGQGGISLSIGNVGNNRSVLLQGFADQVAAAIRLIRECDQPPPPEQQPELATRVQQLEQQIQSLQQQLAKKADKPAEKQQ